MAAIKYGQIGVGHAHAGKIAVYRGSEDFEVVGVVEPDRRLRERARQSALYRDLPWFETPDQLLNVKGLEVVGVETEVGRLLETAELCVRAGKHIHLDKPAGESLSQFRRILDEAARRHLAVQLGYMYRYNPGVVLLRKLLQSGALGEVFEVHTVMSKLMSADARRPLLKYRGGSMFELGCHILDLVVGVLGEPQKVHPFPRHSSNIDDELLDNMLAVLEYPRATATVRSSVTEVDGFARRHLVVCGSEGTLHIQPLDRPQARLTLSRDRDGFQQGPQDVPLPKYERYVDDAADLARIVRGQQDALFSYEHDYIVQQTVLQASAMTPL